MISFLKKIFTAKVMRLEDTLDKRSRSHTTNDRRTRIQRLMEDMNDDLIDQFNESNRNRSSYYDDSLSSNSDYSSSSYDSGSSSSYDSGSSCDGGGCD